MIVLIDNYDSFSYNLYQDIGMINEDIKVIKNDEMTIKEIRKLNPSHIVISPGPGYPKDAGICEEVVKNLKNDVLDEIHTANTKLPASNIRSICGAMMFSGDSADKKVSLLSGGEKSRVMLGQILARDVNLLFLDEPTNHLDMDSIEALTKAIQNFQGSVVLVTHSEELLRRVCDRLIIFKKEGAEYFESGYDLFLEKMGWDEEEDELQKPKQKPKTNNKENKKIRAELIRQRNMEILPLRKRVEKLESSIMKTEELLEANHKKLIEISNSGESSKLMELSKLVSSQESEVEELFEQLESAQNELDSITQEYEEKIAEIED